VNLSELIFCLSSPGTGARAAGVGIWERDLLPGSKRLGTEETSLIDEMKSSSGWSERLPN